MDETTFRLFEDFDFENDQNFQAGWRSIETLIDPKKKRSEYLRAQAFFFAKNVSMFDYQQYLQWRNKQKIKSEGAANENRSNLGSLVHNHEQAEHEDNEDKNILSLAEVAELIQSNQPIPGIISVDVVPSNAEPTPSRMIRKLKPWEVIQNDNLSTELQQPEVTEEFSAV